jgi:2-polyprenyl-3-methyl-5-hydroxy-6-metoxy-1,4-benzoquinol methylase
VTALDYTEIYDPETDFDARFTLATGRRVARWLRPGDRVLELGCATGLMTGMLAGDGRSVLAVDRSEPYLERLRARRLAGVEALAADLRELGDVGRFDHVVLTSVLHEVDDPVALLAGVAEERLARGGLVHVSLQNPLSLHRLVALEMGLIDGLTERSDRGVRFGTQRLYRADEVAELAARAGLEERHREGVFLKPLANDQMAALDPAVLDGLERAARHLPAHGAMNLFAFGHAA